MTKQFHIKLPAHSRGFHLITEYIIDVIKDDLPEVGLLNIFIKHTSSGLTINEDADPSVRDDFDTFFRKLVPESLDYFTHIYEGSDDMPSHILSSLFGSSVSIPISNYKLDLGIWQGIYLGEFRNNGGRRSLTITIIQ